MEQKQQKKKRRNLYKVYPIEENCISCRYCEVACTMVHSESKDPIKAYKLEDLLPRPIVEVEGPVSLSVMCRHCKHPFCLDACISGAIWQDKNGVVHLDEDVCVGCWSCVLVCPFGAVHPHLNKRHSFKCDLCEGRDFPACVEACPNRALVYDRER
ncbi:4Fe-4S dicluster domain-containing protein [Desulfurobacterium sp.]